MEASPGPSGPPGSREMRHLPRLPLLHGSEGIPQSCACSGENEQCTWALWEGQATMWGHEWEGGGRASAS